MPNKTSKDKSLDPVKHSVRGWHYDPAKRWWYHLHWKGFWPFWGGYYLADTYQAGWCLKCYAVIPDDLKTQVMTNETTSHPGIDERD